MDTEKETYENNSFELLPKVSCEGLFSYHCLSIQSIRKTLEKNGAIMRESFRIKTLHLQIGALCITAAPEGSSQDPILLLLWKGMRGHPDGKKSP